MARDRPGRLLPLAVQGVPLAIEFVTGALIDRRPVARIGFLELVAVWWGETWRSFKVFNIDQAWRADFPERPLVRDPSRPTVLLIHGYMCNRATWRHWLHERHPVALERRHREPRAGVRRRWSATPR